MENAEGETDKFGSKLGSLAKGALLAGGAFVAFQGAKEILENTFEAGEKLTKSQQSLDAAIRATGGNVDKLSGSYRDIAKNAANYGVTEDVANKSLAQATLITGNAGKAQKAYTEALNISAATHKSLQSVLLATSKAQDGQTGALSRYGVILDKNASSTDQYNAVMARFKGQAEANTSATDVLKAKLSDFEQEMGAKLVPMVDKVVNFIMAHWPEIQAVMDQVWHSIQPLFAALIAIIKEVVTTIQEHWSQIKPIVDAVVTVIKDAVKIISAALKLVTDLLKGDWSGAWHEAETIVKTALSAVATVVKTELDIAKSAVTAALNAISDVFTSIWNKITKTVSNAFNSVINAIKGAAGLALSAALDVGKAIVNGILNGVDGLYDALKSKLEGSLKSALKSLNPFSPVEHGGSLYIGEPLVAGAVAGLSNLAPALRSTIESQMRTGVKGVNAPGIGLSSSASLSQVKGGGLTLSFAGANFYGSPNKQTAQEWAKALKPALEQVVSY